jgi:shikimate kinase
MNIILIGMRATGKSALGRKIAERLNFKFVDTDKLIVARAGKEVKDIVAEKGWPYFRALEKEVVKKVSEQSRLVIATGGGAVMDEENARHLKKHGVVVLLTADLGLIAERVARHDKRPSLTGTLSPMEEVEKIWRERKERYFEIADVTFDVSQTSHDKDANLRQKAENLLKLLKKFGIHAPEIQ